MKKLYLVVLYKQKYSDSQTLRSFSEFNFGKNKNNFFVIWDNSPSSETSGADIGRFLNTENVEYIHTPENTALSKIYNTSLEKYSDFDFFLIFDQDSKIIRSDYDSYLEKIILENPELNIFLPQIYSKNKLYSPGRFWVFKGWHYKNLLAGIHKDKFYTAIMSGTCVRIDFLKKHNIRFNENLSLYGIDTCFFSDVRKIDKHFYVLEERLEHDLSENHLIGEDLKNHTRLYLKGTLIMNNHSILKTLIVYFKMRYLVNAKFLQV